jgi:ribokinase
MRSPRAGVLVLGSVNLDLTLRTPRLPGPGETVAGAELAESLGGKGANQAVAAARMGAAVSLIACLGDDAAGDGAATTLHAEGVGLEGSRRTDAPTGRAAVLVDDAGENMIVVAAGANASLTVDDVRGARWAPGTRVLLTQLEIAPEVADAGLRAAAARGAISCLNATPASRLGMVGAVPDVLIVNRVEAEQLLDAPRAPASGSPRTAAELAEALARRRGIATVVVTDGGAGAAASVDGGAGETVVGLAPAVRVVDTTGAGDAFAGVFASGLAEGLALPDALARGCAAGALACTSAGAVRSLPQREDVLRLLDGRGPVAGDR